MSTYPPDGWAVTGSGVTWGTDVDFTESSSALSGDGYFDFAATTPAGNPIIWAKTPMVVNGGSPYSVYAPIYSSSNAAGNTWSVGVQWYTNAKAFISNTYGEATFLTTATSTWEIHGGVTTAPANARYARAFVEKKNNAFTGRADRIDFWEMPIAFWAYRNAAKTIGSGAWIAVQPDTEVYDYGGNFDAASNYRFDVPADGLYSLSGCAVLTMTAAGVIGARFNLNGAQWITGQIAEFTGSGNRSAVVVATAAYLQAGDYVELMVQHSSGSTDNLLVGANYYTYFTGARVE